MITERAIFTPSDPAAVLDDFRDPFLSFRDLVARHNTTADALARWCARPDIQERLDAIDNLSAMRTRAIAADHLPLAAHTLSRILQAFNVGQLTPPAVEDVAPQRGTNHSTAHNDAAHSATLPLGHSATSPSPRLSPFALRLRSHELVRHAANNLFRLARFNPGPAPRRVASASAAAPASGFANAPTAPRDTTPPAQVPRPNNFEPAAAAAPASATPTYAPPANTPPRTPDEPTANNQPALASAAAERPKSAAPGASAVNTPSQTLRSRGAATETPKHHTPPAKSPADLLRHSGAATPQRADAYPASLNPADDDVRALETDDLSALAPHRADFIRRGLLAASLPDTS